MPSATPDYSLTEQQKQHFLDHGFIKLENCFSVNDEQCKGLMERMWERLDIDPNDQNTWTPWRGMHITSIHFRFLEFFLEREKEVTYI